MKSVFQFVVLVVLVAFSILPVHADETTVDTPGIYVRTDGANTNVIAPGVNVQTGQAMAPVVTVPKTATAIVGGAPQAASYFNASLPGFDFSNQNLTNVDFTNADLTGANFSNANLTGAIFTNANMTNADLTNAILVRAQMMNVTLTGANLTNANFTQADLTNASLDNALAIGTHFEGAVLTNADMSQMIRQKKLRAGFVKADAIGAALKLDPEHPTAPRKIDLTVNFDFNSDKLTKDGARQVAEIATALKMLDLQKNHIRVEGHTDAVGTDAYNNDLSSRRASTVLHVLGSTYNISIAQLSAQGFGKTRPIASNDNDLGRAMNRRVTLVNMGG